MRGASSIRWRGDGHDGGLKARSSPIVVAFSAVVKSSAWTGSCWARLKKNIFRTRAPDAGNKEPEEQGNHSKNGKETQRNGPTTKNIVTSIKDVSRRI